MLIFNIMKNIVLILITGFSLTGCLKRDNPLDANNPANVQNAKTVLSIQSVEVASKADTHIGDTPDNTYLPNDNIWLEIHLFNSGNFSAQHLTGQISSGSNLINIIPIQSGLQLHFREDIIASGSTAFGEIMSADEQTFSFGPDDNSYAVNFQISSTAVIGDVVNFSLVVKDINNNQWTLPFSITIS
jgi:hypothetical protein